MNYLIKSAIILLMFPAFSQKLKQIFWVEEKSKYIESLSGALMDYHDFKKSNSRKANLEHFTVDSKKINQNESWEISIQYRFFKKNINFLTSHSGLNFGVHDGSLYIKYYYENENNEVFNITQSHIWNIPNDDKFRNYKFKFDSKTKRATISVDEQLVWDFSAINQAKIFWHEEDKIILIDGHIQESAVPYVKSVEISQEK
ncbi:MAG: hypothetical protein SNJ77_02655 [Cytophagales bacterium]